MNRYLTATALLGALTLTGSRLAFAQSPAAPPGAKSNNECFNSIDWTGSKAADAHTLYIRVRTNQIYRLDFAGSCDAMTWPDMRFITRIHGGDLMCSPLDFDLTVSDGHGFEEPCIVSKMTKLSAAEASALPKSQRP